MSGFMGRVTGRHVSNCVAASVGALFVPLPPSLDRFNDNSVTGTRRRTSASPGTWCGA
jgi:hypothetical protein